MPSSDASSTCRIDWRPSRLLVAALLMLGFAGAYAVLASGLPRALAWPLALAAAGQGAWLARRESRRLPGALVLGPGLAEWREPDGAVHRLGAVSLQLRGPCAWLDARTPDGRRLRRSWWPDTLGAAAARELRLARPAGDPAALLPLVAP